MPRGHIVTIRQVTTKISKTSSLATYIHQVHPNPDLERIRAGFFHDSIIILPKIPFVKNSLSATTLSRTCL